MTKIVFKDEKNASKTKNKQVKSIVPTKPLVKHQADVKWYEYASDERADSSTTEEGLKEVEETAEGLLQRDVDLFNQLQRTLGASEATWLATVLTKGTAADRTTALQLLVQKSPVHALVHITTLVSVVEKKNTREAFSVLGILKELFITELIPHNRKLISFSARPVSRLKELSAGSKQNAERRLILWKFESELKKVYEKFIGAVERLAGGTVENVCSQACRTALDLLAECPEQEQKLLSLLVNKLGHPNHKLATKVCGYLLQLTQRQPNMRNVIVTEVERLVYRKNISGRAQLYAVSFLSQIQLRAGEDQLAAHLLNIYFGLFRMLVARGKVEDKILSILLSATNRAFPFAKGQAEKLVTEIDLLYKILHQANFATALQTLKLLSQLSSGGASDRFYTALYRKMLDVNHSAALHNQLFSLLSRVLKADTSNARVTAFVKRILQLSLNRSAAFAAASLILVSRLIEERPELLVLAKTAQKISDASSSKVDPDAFADDEEEHFADVEDNVEIKKEPDIDEKPANVIIKKEERSVSGGWVHKKNIALRSVSNVYDQNARNPLYARAEFAVAAELLLLRNHYHPSVAVFAANLLEGIPIRYDGDPLADFTPMHFLDRFVYRNPKTKKSDTEESAKKLLKKKAYDPLGVKKIPITSQEYINKNKNEIPADERFLHRFATSSMKIKEEKKDEESGDEHDFDDAASVNSEEFDLLLNRFEPGEKNDVFDIDFTKEFSAEKKARKGKKRSAEESLDDEEIDEGSEDDDEGMNDEAMEDEDFGEDDDDEEDEEEYDGIADGEESDEDFMEADKKGEYDEDDSENDFAEKLGYAEDAAISADKFEEMLEDEDDWKKPKKKTPKRRKFKKR